MNESKMLLLWGTSVILAVVAFFAMVALTIDGASGYEIFVAVVSSFFSGGCASAATVWSLCNRKT